MKILRRLEYPQEELVCSERYGTYFRRRPLIDPLRVDRRLLLVARASYEPWRPKPEKR